MLFVVGLLHAADGVESGVHPIKNVKIYGR